MAFEELNGAQIKILREAILRAFVREEDLDMFLATELDKPPLDLFAGGANFKIKVFNMIRDAQAIGWTDDLIAKLQESHPRQILIRNLPDALRMGAAEAPPRMPAGVAMSLEKIVSGGGFADLRIWAEKMSALGQTLCCIQYPIDATRTGAGTGFLVADDLVMTNYHVVRHHISSALDHNNIVCRFDYARDSKGVDQGRPVSLAAGDAWIVAHSPFDNADTTGAGEASPSNLDFALLRLAENAAAHDMPGGMKRGKLQLGTNPALPAKNAPVLVVQHPKARPQALSLGVVKGPTANGARYRYDADTLEGSSGSPVLDQHLNICALHHAGDPLSEVKAEFNQGIPMSLIVAMLAQKGVPKFWN